MNRTRRRLYGGAIALVFIVIGAVLMARPFVDTWMRGRLDADALSSWNDGGWKDVAGRAAAASVTTPAACGAHGAASDAYALVSFTGLQPQYAYAGVAADGDWSALQSHTMVHWHGSPAPGQEGNVIIAFHREPDFQHIDSLDVGQTVVVQDRSCRRFTYRVTQVWTLDPSRVTQLVPTGGHQLTLITCTPFWIDTQRIVWRAQLVPQT